jgi:hypothetical protein
MDMTTVQIVFVGLALWISWLGWIIDERLAAIELRLGRLEGKPHFWSDWNTERGPK